MLPFIFGRIIVIETFIRVRGAQSSIPYFLISEKSQHNAYREVIIAGDLSQGDLGRALDLGGTDLVSLLLMDFGLPPLTSYQERCRTSVRAPIW